MAQAASFTQILSLLFPGPRYPLLSLGENTIFPWHPRHLTLSPPAMPGSAGL